MKRLRTALKWAAGVIGFASAAYATYVAVTWVRYGNPPSPKPEEADALLDRFMPEYEVVDWLRSERAESEHRCEH